MGPARFHCATLLLTSIVCRCRKVEGALGAYDPRKLKKTLESRGVECWIDVEQAGQVGVSPTNCRLLFA